MTKRRQNVTNPILPWRDSSDGTYSVAALDGVGIWAYAELRNDDVIQCVEWAVWLAVRRNTDPIHGGDEPGLSGFVDYGGLSVGKLAAEAALREWLARAAEAMGVGNG